MSKIDPDRLAQENAQVLNLVQALMGAVSVNMRAISLEWEKKGGRLHFILERDDPEDREEIADIGFEFEALQAGPIKLELMVTVDDKELPVMTLPGRQVYRRRETCEGAG